MNKLAHEGLGDYLPTDLRRFLTAPDGGTTKAISPPFDPFFTAYTALVCNSILAVRNGSYEEPINKNDACAYCIATRARCTCGDSACNARQRPALSWLNNAVEDQVSYARTIGALPFKSTIISLNEKSVEYGPPTLNYVQACSYAELDSTKTWLGFSWMNARERDEVEGDDIAHVFDVKMFGPKEVLTVRRGLHVTLGILPPTEVVRATNGNALAYAVPR